MPRPAVLALAALLLVGACGSDTPSPEESLPAPTLEPTPTESATIVDVEVQEGEVVGGMKRVEVPLDDLVRLNVRSDVADEVHVHGYDEREDVPAGGGVTISFEADIPGVFVVELEERSLHLVELEGR